MNETRGDPDIHSLTLVTWATWPFVSILLLADSTSSLPPPPLLPLILCTEIVTRSLHKCLQHADSFEFICHFIKEKEMEKEARPHRERRERTTSARLDDEKDEKSKKNPKVSTVSTLLRPIFSVTSSLCSSFFFFLPPLSLSLLPWCVPK